jgi:hypothetical protein
MTDEETRRQWYATLEQSRALLDRPPPAPTRDLFRPDALQKWAERMPQPEFEKPAPKLDTAPVPAAAAIDWSAVDERIEAAIEAHCTPMLEVVGEELADSFRDATFESKMELAEETRKLRGELAELQAGVAELRQALAHEQRALVDNVTVLPPRPGIRRRMSA